MGQFSIRSEGRSSTVLVIDDSNYVLETTRFTLERAGYRVITRNRPSGTITAILNEKPDIVLLDLNMPMLSGEDILKILTSTQNRSATIVLLHSGLPTEALRSKVLKTGAHGYVQKTDDSAEFLRRIEYWLKKQKEVSRPKLDRTPEEPSPEVDPLPAIATWPRPREVLTLPATSPSTLPAPRDSATLPVASRPNVPLVTVPSPVRALASVLFVDDDWTLLKAYETAVGATCHAGYVSSAEEALTCLLGETPPDIVVCDLVMPTMTGADLYRRAVAADASWARRFLFVSAATSMPSVAEFLNGIDAKIFFKPVAGERLVEAIRKAYGLLTSPDC